MLHDHAGSHSLLCAPTLLLSEVANVLRFKSEASEAFVQQAMRDLQAMDLLIVPPAPSSLESAVTISLRYGLTIYDASFVALAETMEADFVTADERLADRLASLPFVRTLRQWPLV